MKTRIDTPQRRLVPAKGTLCSEAGQSMVELLVILPVMLLLIFGTIQFALIYNAKITLNYAAFEAVRAGTLNCDKKYQEFDKRCTSDVGQFDAVKEGFARGLAPLYSYFEPDAEKRKEMEKPALNQVEAYQQGRARIFEEFKPENDFIRIERLNPTVQAFSDFAKDEVIPNDNLMYRSKNSMGSSKMSMQEANLLHLRFTYWYPLHVPLINKLMFDRFICCKGMEGNSLCKWANDPVCQGDKPRIPLTSASVMRMQTPVENSQQYYTPR